MEGRGRVGLTFGLGYGVLFWEGQVQMGHRARELLSGLPVFRTDGGLAPGAEGVVEVPLKIGVGL